MYRKLTFIGFIAMAFWLATGTWAANQYTYQVDPMPGYIGSSCSDDVGFQVDYLATGSDCCPTANEPNYAAPWVKFDIPDFNSMTPQQKIVKVELVLEVNDINEWYGPNEPNYGIDCYVVADPMAGTNWWDSTNIYNGWDLLYLNKIKERGNNWGLGPKTTDITDSYMLAEWAGGDSPFSLRFKSNPKKSGSLKDPYLIITTEEGTPPRKKYFYHIVADDNYVGSSCSGGVGFVVNHLTTGSWYCPGANVAAPWIKYDIPDFNSMTPQQKVAQVDLVLDVHMWNVGGGPYGVACYTVFDPLAGPLYWDSENIYNQWPLHLRRIVEREPESEWGTDMKITDITSLYQYEWLGGDSPFSLRFKSIPAELSGHFSGKGDPYLIVATEQGWAGPRPASEVPPPCCPSSPRDIIFDGGGDGYSFSDADNWDETCVPCEDNWVKINGVRDVNIAIERQIERLHIGEGSGSDTSLTIMNGGGLCLGMKEGVFVGYKSGVGTLNIYGLLTEVSNLIIGNINGYGTVNIYPGAELLLGYFTIGNAANAGTSPAIGTVNMNGGFVEADNLYVGLNGTGADGHLQLNDGTIECGTFVMRRDDANGTMDIHQGLLIIDGDRRTRFNRYIDRGWITAYDANGIYGTHPNAIVVTYYDANNQTEVRAATLEELSTAYNPIVNIDDEYLAWTPGYDANQHDVYFGTDYNSVRDANTTIDPNNVYQGRLALDANSLAVDFDLDATYYWRVDEVNGANVINGSIWSITINDGRAYNPIPENEAELVNPEIDPAWTKGDLIVDHTVYFGTDPMVENNPDTPTTEPNIDVGLLDFETTYYWRVDGIEKDHGTIIEGNEWSLTTANYITIDDFEGYQPCDRWEAYNCGEEWQGGGDTQIYSASGISGDGMRFVYNLNTAGRAYIRRTFEQPQDFTRGNPGVKSISLSFSGNPEPYENDDDFYMVLKDAEDDEAVVYYPDQPDLKKQQWQDWYIEIEEFNNVDVELTQIKELIVGFGTWGVSVRGTGEIVIDDIRLNPPICVAEHSSPADLNKDCSIDYEDLKIMADSWLDQNPDVTVTEPNWSQRVLYYDFEDSGMELVTDLSGNGIHGTLQGFDSEPWVPGFNGQAIYFDGNNDRVINDDSDFLHDNLPYVSEIGDGQRQADATMNFWMKADPNDNTTNYCGVAGWGVYDGAVGSRWLSCKSSGTKLFWYKPNFNSGPIAADTWQMITVVIDQKDDAPDYAYIYVYINGVLSNWDDGPCLARSGYDIILELGHFPKYGYGTRHWEGALDEFSIWNYCLSQNEINYLLLGRMPADLNQDNAVNFEDYARLAEDWLQNPPLWP